MSDYTWCKKRLARLIFFSAFAILLLVVWWQSRDGIALGYLVLPGLGILLTLTEPDWRL